MSESLVLEKENNEIVSDCDESVERNELSIGEVIDCFIHRVLDIEDCAYEFIPLAQKNHKLNATNIKSELYECIKLLEPQNCKEQKIAGEKKFRKTIRTLDRHRNSSHVETLKKSLFINLFAAFDKYIGDLIAALYHKKDDLYKNINRQVELSDALKYDSMATFREAMLEKEIETLRRKSYLEQFQDLENKFNISTLKKFDNWSNFIECSQRRNLFTHCDGIVSKQYLQICNNEKFQFKNKPDIGSKLHLEEQYLFQSCSLIIEVAVMLGQTLWRKTLPEEIVKADKHLSELIFDFLHMEQWDKSICLSKFALKLPKISNDEMERIFTVNYAIAVKATGTKKELNSILSKKDWSATTYDFKLAHAILTDDYLIAGNLMQRMGKKGELINEMCYHDWPLFKDFRNSEAFFSAYESIYGYQYSEKISALAEEKRPEIEQNTLSENNN